MLASFTAWLENLPFAMEIAQADWLFPMIECIHVLALTIVFGSISIIDLRLINVSLKTRAVAELTREVLPWTWGAFLVAAASGSLMFSSAATRYSGLWPFKVKMVLLLLAGVNMAVFHLGCYKTVSVWGSEGRTAPAARAAGAVSLIVWTGIIVCGRVVGFL